MNDGDQLRMAGLAQGLGNLARLDNPPPGGLGPDDPGAAPGRDIGHASAEHAVDSDNDFVARLDQVDETKLHAGAASAADRKRQFVASQEDLAEHFFDLVHYPDEQGIKMAYQRLRHGPQDRGSGIARPRPHQQPRRETGETKCIHGSDNATA